MHFKWEILLIDDHSQAIFPQIRVFFRIPKKGPGRRPSPRPPLSLSVPVITAQKMKFSIKYFFSIGFGRIFWKNI